MIVALVSQRMRTSTRQAWASVAFIVESILLLVFLVGSLALLTRVFTASLNRSVESRTLDAATIAATSIAEHFAADPTGVEERTTLGDLVVSCTVTDDVRASGTMYYAHIDVYDIAGGNGGPVYSIDTSRYSSNPVVASDAASGGSAETIEDEAA